MHLHTCNEIKCLFEALNTHLRKLTLKLKFQSIILLNSNILQKLRH